MRSHIQLACLTSLLLALGGASAYAQQNTVEDFREIADKIVTESKIFPLVRTADDGASSPEPRVDLFATSDGTIAKARIGYLLKNFVALDVSFSAPVSGGVGRLATQKGLGGGATGEGAMRLVLHRSQRAQPLASGFMTHSASLMGVRSLPLTVSGQGLDQADFSFDQLIGAAIESAAAIRTAGGPAAARSSLPSSSPIAVASTVMTPQEVASAAQRLEGERGREAFASAFRLLANDLESWQVDRAVILSLSAKVGRPEFTLVEGSAFKNINRNTRIREISLGFIQSMSRDKLTRGIYAGLTITAGSTYTGTQRQTCMPTGDSGVTQCRNALLAEPGKTDVELYQGELRYYFDSLRFAAGFRPGYNKKAAENEKWSIEVPIMFLQNSKDLHSALADDKAGLTGGLTIGWKDSPAGTAFFAVFSVGSLFKLPGVPQ